MSQAAVEKALGKLITDECFRRRFFKDPAGVSFYAGLELSQAELEALSRLPVEAIARFSARLDHRICRLPLDEESGSVDLTLGRSTKWQEEEEGGPIRQGTPQAPQGRTDEHAGQCYCSPQKDKGE